MNKKHHDLFVLPIPEPPIIKFKRLYQDVEFPKYATVGSACFDFYSYIKRRISSGQTVIVDTGLAAEVPKGYMLELRPRSGLSSQGIMLANAPGTIDSDYRGSIKVILHNSSRNTFIINKNDRIAQGRLVRLLEVELVEVEELTETERGEGGLGSTGK